MTWYIVEIKRVIWNRNGKFWMESTEEHKKWGNSFQEVLDDLELKIEDLK